MKLSKRTIKIATRSIIIITIFIVAYIVYNNYKKEYHATVSARTEKLLPIRVDAVSIGDDSTHIQRIRSSRIRLSYGIIGSINCPITFWGVKFDYAEFLFLVNQVSSITLIKKTNEPDLYMDELLFYIKYHYDQLITRKRYDSYSLFNVSQGLKVTAYNDDDEVRLEILDTR